MESLRESMGASFVLILAAAVVLNLLVFGLMDQILYLLQVPEDIEPLMREYLWAVFWGICATFVYNFFACLLRAVGNSGAPLVFLAVSAVVNIVLDLWFVVGLQGGVAGAAWATVIAQALSGAGLAVYTAVRARDLLPSRADCRWDWKAVRELGQYSALTCLQ